MLLLKPDPTFYPSAKLAMQAPAESLAYVAAWQDGWDCLVPLGLCIIVHIFDLHNDSARPEASCAASRP
jgi:hypothetical protein